MRIASSGMLPKLAAAAQTIRIGASTPEQTAPIDTLVLGLKTAWQDGAVRPTSKPKPKQSAADAARTHVSP
jgi:hypothetical protein